MIKELLTAVANHSGHEIRIECTTVAAGRWGAQLSEAVGNGDIRRTASQAHSSIESADSGEIHCLTACSTP